MNFCIFGAGAWGTAMSIHLHRLGHTVTLVPRRLAHAAAIATTRENAEHLPGAPLHPDIQVAHEPAPPLMEADVVLLACPSRGLRALAGKISRSLDAAWRVRVFISLAKGLEEGTLLRPSQIIEEVLPGRRHGVLSGPSNAGEVVRGLPTALVFAGGGDPALSQPVQAALSGGALRIYHSPDVAGVELGGVLKNVYAIGAGICDGLELGENAKAAYLTRAVQEMLRVGGAAGGQTETFLGLSGVGDLIATAHGGWSRNRAFGEAVARGENIQRYLAASSAVVEGYRATANFLALARRCGISAPILEELNSVLFRAKDPRAGVAALLNRLLKSEN
ncbi:MAG: NAD(P)-dependent glycerol-3-phosphate dehydrogenase [Puniceicoccales bacterium]|jgi:glycerol-3-phosphate dehydrogenase (NAD(P)+)|nr:NAD(P)-dependent glycerol-3-phosphate dehydrogenase [Puniceicoccales bacterium]